MESWMYVDSLGSLKGPIPTNILLKLLEKGINISGETTVWKEGMAEWEKMANVEPFSKLSRFLSKQWYYIDSNHQTKGPILSRLIIHKLRQGEIDGFTSVYGDGMQQWAPLSEISELKEAAQKIAEEEQQTQQILNSLPPEEVQVFVEDDGVKLQTQYPSATTDREKKRFVADDGVRYTWDDALQDWVEDDNTLSQSGSDDEWDEENENDGEVDAKNPLATDEGAEKKKKRKKKKRDTSEWKDLAGAKFWIYIENLPLDVTSEELKAHFCKVGLIALSPVDQLPKIKIYRDENGDPKGDASICYNAAESVDMAVNFFDGGYIRPNTKPISVSRAEFQKKNHVASDPSVTAANDESQQKKKKGKVTHAQVKVTQNAMAQALAWNEDDDLGVSKRRALRIVVVEGMFHPSDSEGNPQFFEELEKEIAEEFEKCGPLEKITVFSKNPKGVVIVKFATAFAAQECVRIMDGRYFGGKKLRSTFWDGVTNYSLDGQAPGQQQGGVDVDEKRLEEFGDWLEHEQEDLPEEFRLRTE